MCCTNSIRSSIAVLAGSWSGSSQAMMKSHDINLFLVPFEFICELLSEVNIDFNWEEKEKEKAFDAWHRYNHLTQEERDNIGRRMIGSIEDKLILLIEAILDDSIEREVEKIVVEIVSNLGEVKVYEFATIEDALKFLNQEDLKELFLTTDSLTLFDPPPEFD